MSLSRTRFAPSPAAEVTSWLGFTAFNQRHPHFGLPGAGARCALRDPDVAMIAAVLPGRTGYTLDMLTPRPSITTAWPRALREQLEIIRETPDTDVARQLLLGRYPNNPMPDGIRRAMESGAFARRAVDGLRRFWSITLADQWKALSENAAADMADRARTMATHGVGHVLHTLHPDLTWTGQELRIDKPYDEIGELRGHELVLSPSLLAWPVLRVQLCDPDNAVISYPVREPFPARPGRRSALPDLLGPSRAAILRDLDVPRSTTELSHRHDLAASTVSYHLGVLLNAGLVARTRQGANVRYQRAEAGDTLLRSEPPLT
ncbi:ArsR/SmtB family transcription factor [Planobispora longispora]|uniref:Transcriptional regulator n=1 Tax=Planobispora longispora TaxID=28887 RepID=A0A8J3RQM4_9ACTN|nr:winged helix-turn-helix domain-containing protein [Planobispora longispora]GIH80002.1 transcriptional regulator [Planobispora longispora]